MSKEIKRPKILKDKVVSDTQIAKKKSVSLQIDEDIGRNKSFYEGKGNAKMPDKEIRKDFKSEKVVTGEYGTRRETNEKSQFLQKDESNHEFFGVKSYLHNFYESVSIRNPQLYEDIFEDEMIYLNQERKQRKAALFCWKFNMAMGAFTLCLGVIFILVGYLIPLHDGITGHQKDFVFVDRNAAKFNYYVKLCRILGLIIFCIGGCVFCFTMLLSFFFNVQNVDDDDDSTEPLYVAYTAEDVPRSPTDKKIPATEELASVQPKRDTEEVVITNSGFCKPSVIKSNSDN